MPQVSAPQQQGQPWWEVSTTAAKLGGQAVTVTLHLLPSPEKDDITTELHELFCSVGKAKTSIIFAFWPEGNSDGCASPWLQ